MQKLLLSLLSLAIISGCTMTMKRGLANETKQQLRKPKNIVLMIGDGMGLTQVTAALYSNHNTLNITNLPIIGLHKSYSYDSLITDSAAGATAFAIGEKTFNYGIGVGPDTLGRNSILELAEIHGLATGMLTTCDITHATPASFIAHRRNRNLHEDIALDFLNTDIDLFIGGGKKYFERRKDERNLCTELEQRNYYVTDFTREPLEMMVWPDRNVAFFTADIEPLPAEQGRDYLPLASSLSLNFLKNRSKEGFFLMIEGSQIDWGGHANNSNYIITETLDFDKAVGAVLEWAARDGETLVIVTADHETGGYAIITPSKMDSLVTAFTTPMHTADLIPVYAFGPGARYFSGVYENTDIFKKMKMLFGF